MKIGILTFFNAINPGSALQAFALQEAIRKTNKEVECDFLNFHPYRMIIRICGIKKYVYSVLKCFRAFVSNPRLWLRKIKFFMFQRRYLNVAPYTRIGELETLNSSYDKFIVGSDQVWNPQITKNDSDVFFLKFVSKHDKKIAYSASIGLDDYSDGEKKHIGSMMSDFCKISVREQQGAAVVFKMIGKKPCVVLDPTLLFDADWWLKLIKKDTKKKYVFVYGIKENNSLLLSLAEKLSRETGLSTIQITGGWHNHLQGTKKVYVYDPVSWLELIYGATFVITDSFHGVAFSLNFNKQFFVCVNKLSICKSRLYNIIEGYGLNDRFVDENTLDFSSIKCIDYTVVNKKIEEDRGKSWSFLNDAVNF